MKTCSNCNRTIDSSSSFCDFCGAQVEAGASGDTIIFRTPSPTEPPGDPWALRPPDIAPPDMSAADVRPPDVAPPDMRPPDMRPPDVAPPDVEPPAVTSGTKRVP